MHAWSVDNVMLVSEYAATLQLSLSLLRRHEVAVADMLHNDTYGRVRERARQVLTHICEARSQTAVWVEDQCDGPWGRRD